MRKWPAASTASPDSSSATVGCLRLSPVASGDGCIACVACVAWSVNVGGSLSAEASLECRREGEDEPSFPAVAVLDPDPLVMYLHEPLGDSQAETSTTACLAPVEHLEDAGS